MAGMGAEIYESNDNHDAYDLIKSYVDEISLGLSQVVDLPPDVLIPPNSPSCNAAPKHTVVAR